MTDNQSFVGWAILELMGHRRLAGWLSEQQVAGAAFVRLDVPTADGNDGDAGPFDATQLYAPSAVYCITPTNEETAPGRQGLPSRTRPALGTSGGHANTPTRLQRPRLRRRRPLLMMIATEILSEHQPLEPGNCCCGWAGPPAAFADHQLAALDAAGYRLSRPDLSQDPILAAGALAIENELARGVGYFFNMGEPSPDPDMVLAAAVIEAVTPLIEERTREQLLERFRVLGKRWFDSSADPAAQRFGRILLGELAVARNAAAKEAEEARA